MTLPLSRPILATVGVIVFVHSWNNYPLPLVMLNRESIYPWPLGIMAYQGEYSTDWQLVLAFVTLTILPAIVMFVVAQKYPGRGSYSGRGEGLRGHEQGRHRHHRLRQYQRGLPEGGFDSFRFWMSRRADLRPEAAAGAGGAIRDSRLSVKQLLADPDIEIVVNLTVPLRHVEVGLQAIAAGKHVHSEKPLGIGGSEARTLLDAAAARDLRVGCAPDTFLGGSHQTCRKLVDEGAIGQPLGGTAFFMCPGHERWHPNPASTMRAVADRCSTWGRTTSPTWSICSARWRKWPA